MGRYLGQVELLRFLKGLSGHVSLMRIGYLMAYKLTRDEMIKRGKQVEKLRFPTVASLYGIQNDPTRPAELLGTGTYIQHRKDVFVLTAMHVVKNSQKYKYVFHDGGGQGEKMVPCRSGWTGTNNASEDLALWGCFPELFETSNKRPLLLVKPFGVTDSSDDAFFIASGWPAEQAISLHHIREYRTALHTIMGKAVDVGNIPARSFAFNCANNINYSGMSGSPVWNLKFHRCSTAEDWTPQMSTFAGVVTRWDKASGLIFATRAEAVKAFLSVAIERLRNQWKEKSTN